ncbi:MAG TPA: GatB/YqeY domain-containing protein [Ginsengibacter sp.]|nr:GatB/YqeY domain-containing protein [Ginsengibacter sp.]HRP43357.1 GatB/YqeY domain-containing protein [Ginsengibacter sp.]
MSLEQQVADGIKKAMLAREEATLRTLRDIKSAILLAKTSEGFTGEISPADEMKMLQKMVKQRKDSLEIYEKQGRADLAAREKEEIAVIEGFLPKQMTEGEIREAVKAAIAETGASSMADMGRVMGVINKELAGKADGKTIATLVKEALNSI